MIAFTGCASVAPPPASPTDLAALDAWDRAPSATPPVVIAGRVGPRARAASVPAPRVRERRVDVALEAAPLESALRLLAEAGGLSLVAGEALGEPVTIELHRVRPLEAMRALAWAHGVELEQSGAIVVARKRR